MLGVTLDVSPFLERIGKELMRATQREGGQATVILLSAPKAVEYYPHAGFTQHPSAWVLPAGHSIP